MPHLQPVGVLGIVGGLGPIASAEFLRTIYEYGAADAEQHMPAVMMSSDPTMPDRTTALMSGRRTELLVRLRQAVEQLITLHCDRIVVCCVTMHSVIPELPLTCQERIVSVVDVAMAQIRARAERHLLLCSCGTRQMRIFETHPAWPDVEPFVVLPAPVDQEAIHRCIYEIKRTGEATRWISWADGLLAKYGVQSLAVGCTEFHLLAKAARRTGARWQSSDPLDAIAKAWARVAPIELLA